MKKLQKVQKFFHFLSKLPNALETLGESTKCIQCTQAISCIKYSLWKLCPKSHTQQKKIQSMISRWLKNFDQNFFRAIFFTNWSKFLYMHQHYFFHQQMFQSQLRAFLPPIEVPASSFPFSKKFLLTKRLKIITTRYRRGRTKMVHRGPSTSKKWTFQHVEWSNDCSLVFTHKIGQAFKLRNQTQISPNFH